MLSQMPTWDAFWPATKQVGPCFVSTTPLDSQRLLRPPEGCPTSCLLMRLQRSRQMRPTDTLPMYFWRWLLIGKGLIACEKSLGRGATKRPGTQPCDAFRPR